MFNRNLWKEAVGCLLPTRFRVPLRDALERSGIQGELSVSIAPIPITDGDIVQQSIQIAASIDVVQSIVLQGS
jgi:hypothetical protein